MNLHLRLRLSQVLVDVQRLLSVIDALPTSNLFAGGVAYVLMNDTTLRAPCYASGPTNGLRLRQSERCRGAFGPFPFVGGWLEIMSWDVQAWAAPRFQAQIEDEISADIKRMRCQYEGEQICQIRPLTAPRYNPSSCLECHCALIICIHASTLG